MSHKESAKLQVSTHWFVLNEKCYTYWHRPKSGLRAITAPSNTTFSSAPTPLDQPCCLYTPTSLHVVCVHLPSRKKLLSVWFFMQSAVSRSTKKYTVHTTSQISEQITSTFRNVIFFHWLALVFDAEHCLLLGRSWALSIVLCLLNYL
jgi:hypothetical protein